VPPLPGRCQEAPRRLPKSLAEDTLSVLNGASRFFAIETVHLVAAFGEECDRSPASLTSMEATMKEKLLAALAEQTAVVGMRRQWPFAEPVGDHPYGDTTAKQGLKVLEHNPSFTAVGRSGIVDTDEEWLRS